jgi:tRNA(adenine34) deaminase
MDDQFFMRQALIEAEKAFSAGEFPVGCVLVHEQDILVRAARTGTSPNSTNEIDHAEMIALRRLLSLGKRVPLNNLALYCTMEPCLMCFGAILLSGIAKIVYAYEDTMGGASRCDPAHLPPLYQNRQVSIVPHVLRHESLALFKAYFSNPANVYWKGSLLADYTLAQ